MGIAPARRRRSTSVASSVEGGAFFRPSVPAVTTVPASSSESLMLNGTPWSGPRGSLASAAAASASALSVSTCMAALIFGLMAAIRSRCAATNSRDETRRSRISRACWVAE